MCLPLTRSAAALSTSPRQRGEGARRPHQRPGLLRCARNDGGVRTDCDLRLRPSLTRLGLPPESTLARAGDGRGGAGLVRMWSRRSNDGRESAA